ncbi:MAG: hypothetical protein RL711_1551 [Bacteroidota bacterium]|jgi:plasmid stabilization system protein ParE
MKIIYKDNFVHKLEFLIEYIAKDKPKAAKRFYTVLIKSIHKIPKRPYSFRKSIYFDDDTIRDLIFKGYTIVFRISENQIEIFGLINRQEKP